MRRFERPYGHAYPFAALMAAVSVLLFGALFDASASERPPAAGGANAAGGSLGAEDLELRTRNSKTFTAADGRGMVTRVYSGPAHFKDDRGEWLEIDNTLERVGDKLRNRRNGYGLEMPERLDSAPVTVREGGDWLSFRLEGARGAASASGNTATFDQALPGVKVAYEAQPSAVKESIILDGPDSPATFRYAVAGSAGLNAAKTPDGGIEFTNAAGDLAFALPAPFMYEHGASADASTAVSYDLDRDGAGWALTVRADRDWLTQPDRKWPVTVDPTVWFNAADRDCTLDQGTPTTNLCDATTVSAGRDAGQDHRALLKFNVTASVPKNAVVQYARMSLYESGNTKGVTKKIGAYRVTRAWQEGATWNTVDGLNAWTTPGGQFDATLLTDNEVGSTPGWENWWISKQVQKWVDGTDLEYGILLKDSAATPVDNEVRFNSSENATANQRPTLEVRWYPRVGEGPSYTYDEQALNDRTAYKVNVGNGNLELISNDVNVAGTGLDLAFSRYYNSGWAHWYGGQFGGAGTSNLGKDVWLDTTPAPDHTMMFHPGTGGAYPFFKKSGVFEWDTPSDLGLNADLKEAAAPDDMELTFRGSDLKYIWRGGSVREMRDRNNNKITFAYDGNGNLDSMTDSQNKVFDVTVNGDGFISQIADPTGRTWKYQYGTGVEWNLLKIYTDPAGKQTLYDWDGNANLLLKVTTPGGRQTKFTYFGDRKLKSVTRVDTVAAQTGPTTNYAYFVGGAPCQTDQNRTVVTDPRGKQTTYCASQKDDRVAKVRDAKGHDQDTKYTTFGNVQQLTRPGSPTSSVSNLNWEGGTNNLLGGTSPTGGMFDLTYDAATTGQKHQPRDYINPQGGGQRFAYDSKGNVTGVTATKQGPAGRSDRLLEAEKAELTRHPDGTIATARDGRNSGNLNTTWTYSYTGGNLTKVTPPTTTGGGITQLGPTTLTYDGLSRVKTITDGKGQVRTFTYDALDRVTNVELKNSAGAVLASESVAYDDDGNMLTRNDVEGTTTKTTSVTYDALNRMTKETLPGAKTNEYTYDPTGNALTVKTNAVDTVSYTYDDVNLLASLVEPPDTTGAASPTTTFGYDDRNNRTSVQYPNGVQVTQKFFGDDTVDQIEATKGTTVLRRFTYTYKQGAQQTDLRQTVTDKDGNVTAYVYDHLDRLKKATTKTSAGAAVDEFLYDYDAATNITRKSKQVGTGTAAVTSYGYNQANQLCWLVSGAQASACGATAPTGATTFAYDANGNTLSGNRSYAYNVKDQTTSIAGTGLAYLGLSQDELTGIGSQTFQNAGVGITEWVSGTNTYRFRRDPGGQLLGAKHPGGRYYYVWDGLGSTVTITDGAGAVANSYKYEPYGSVDSSSGTLPNPFKFASGHDTGVGVYHFGARQYDPALGRWTQQDPLDQIGDLREGNRYGYGAGDPVNLVDPRGTNIFEDAWNTYKDGVDLVRGGVKCANAGMASAIEVPRTRIALGEAAGPSMRELTTRYAGRTCSDVLFGPEYVERDGRRYPVSQN